MQPQTIDPIALASNAVKATRPFQTPDIDFDKLTPKIDQAKSFDKSKIAQIQQKIAFNEQKTAPQMQSNAVPTFNPSKAPIGGISSPFGAENINSKPMLWWATAPQIWQQQQIINNQPKTPEIIPETGVEKPNIYGELFDDINLNGLTEDEVAELYPEIPEDIRGSLYDDIKLNGLTEDELAEFYPEISNSVPEMNWSALKGLQAPQTFKNIDPWVRTEPGPRDPKKTGKNALPSLANVGIDIANMWLSPKETVKSLLRTAAGSVYGLTKKGLDATGLTDSQEMNAEEQQIIDKWGVLGSIVQELKTGSDWGKAILEYLKGYGDPEELQRRVEEEPFQVISDFLSIIEWSTPLLKYGAKAGKLTKVSEAVGKVGQFASKYEPYNVATGLGLKGAEKAVDLSKTVYAGMKDLVQSGKEAYAWKVTWLSPKAIETIKTNPKRAEVEVGQLTEDSLMTKVGDKVQNILKELWETGSAYKPLRENKAKVNVSEKLPIVTEILDKYKVKVTPEGTLDFSDSRLQGATADMKAVQEAYDIFKRGEIDTDVFLNKRGQMSDSINRKSGTNDTANALVKELRSELNSQGHKVIPGLQELDAVYSPQVEQRNEVAKMLWDKTTGELKEGAKSKIMNSVGVNKEATLAKLEELFPDLALEVDALRTAREVDALGGIKPGTYNKSLLVAGGAKAGWEIGSKILNSGPILGIPGAIIGSIMWFIATDPTYIISKIKGKDLKVPQEILDKIKNKEMLNIKQSQKVQEAIKASNDAKFIKDMESKFQSVNKALPLKDTQPPAITPDGTIKQSAISPKATPKGVQNTREIGPTGVPYKKVAEVPKDTKVKDVVKEPEIDTFQAMTKLDTDPTYKVVGNTRTVRNGDMTVYWPIDSFRRTNQYEPIEFTINGKKYPAKEIDRVWRKKSAEEIAESKKPVDNSWYEAQKALRKIESSPTSKSQGSNLQWVLQSKGYTKVAEVPESEAVEILKLTRARTVKALPKGTKVKDAIKKKK